MFGISVAPSRTLHVKSPVVQYKYLLRVAQKEPETYQRTFPRRPERKTNHYMQYQGCLHERAEYSRTVEIVPPPPPSDVTPYIFLSNLHTEENTQNTQDAKWHVEERRRVGNVYLRSCRSTSHNDSVRSEAGVAFSGETLGFRGPTPRTSGGKPSREKPPAMSSAYGAHENNEEWKRPSEQK